MLVLAVALFVQDAPLPPVSPGLCRATADRLEPIVAGVRRTFNEDAKAASEGRTPRYDDAKRTAMMRLLEADAAKIRKVQRRYPAATLSAADTATLGAMNSPTMADYVEVCAK